MTAYSFEIIAKRAVSRIIKEKYGEAYSVDDLHMVSFSKVMKNMKILLIDNAKTRRYYECTLNAETNFMVTTVYEKAHEEGKALTELFKELNMNKGENNA